MWYRDPCDPTRILDMEKICDSVNVAVVNDSTMNIIGTNFVDGDPRVSYPTFALANVVRFESERLKIGKPN